MPVKFPDTLELGHVDPATEDWRLLREFRVWLSGGDWPVQAVTVPAGFITDGPSIPRWARGFVPIQGWMWPASVMHDWLYVAEPQGWTRKLADQVFYEGLLATAPGFREEKLAETMHDAVRVGGGHLWGDATELRTAHKMQNVSVG